jgi:sulfhydrogenase subunit beta (sulfur reductase)
MLTRDGLAALIDELRRDGRDVIGPTVRDGAIVYASIRGVSDLPEGVGDEQAPGRYRLRRRDDAALFGYAVGPRSYKRELLVPVTSLVKIRRSKDGLAFDAPPRPRRPLALFGARSCELAAIAVQDRVLLEGPFADADYAARREDVFVVALQCGEAGGTCFCVSMGTGPRAESGFDLALTELLDASGHHFFVEVGSDAGRAMLDRIPHAVASADDRARSLDVSRRTAEHMGRTLDTRRLPELLVERLEHPRWDDVASRCLGCTNCTLVCPTCFCTTVEDHVSLDGESAERTRRWDSCFTLPFSHLPGGSVRTSIRSRYRQWLTHKLATWVEQFGTSGCVGCGRCITWCPVGIDITEEATAIRADIGARPGVEEGRDG